jgi:hypothetical protein
MYTVSHSRSHHEPSLPGSWIIRAGCGRAGKERRAWWPWWCCMGPFGMPPPAHHPFLRHNVHSLAMVVAMCSHSTPRPPSFSPSHTSLPTTHGHPPLPVGLIEQSPAGGAWAKPVGGAAGGSKGPKRTTPEPSMSHTRGSAVASPSAQGPGSGNNHFNASAVTKYFNKGDSTCCS